MGPTSRTASVSQDVANPADRGTSFEQLRAAYYEQVSALVKGGVDLLLLETIFDTLNAKAALFAVEQYFEESGRRVPLMVSVTIVDQSGRTLSGQTIEAFWISISHIPLLSVGINCALGAKQMRPYIEELSQIAPVHISCHPNAGLPNAFGGFDETPESMAKDLGEFAANGWLNIVGGCCGTTPAHIRAIAATVRGAKPHLLVQPDRTTRLSGLEPLTFRPDMNFVNVGERTNVTGSPKFAKLILNGQFEDALAVARQQVEAGAQIIDINMDEGLIDSETAMTRFINLISSEPDIARVPFMIDSSKWTVIEAGLRCLQGKGIVNSISMKEGEAPFLEQARKVQQSGAAAVVIWRWYDAVVLGSDAGCVRLWEPAHGEVAAQRRRPQQHYDPGTRAYLSAGLPGAEWWVAGRAVDQAEDAEVELDEVERLYTEHDMWSSACG